MKIRYDRIIVFALAVLTLAGCRETPIEEPEGDYISFGTAAMSAQDTRSGAGSTLVDTDEELQGQAFGIYGYKSVDDKTNFVNVFTSTAAQKVYYTSSELSKTDASGNAYTVAANTWTYDDRQKWERAKHYRFRAFWPYKADIYPSSTAKFLLIDYKQVYDYDLMVAYATRYPMGDKTEQDPTGTRRVPLTFKHALSGIKFQFRYKDGLTNISDKVTRLYVKGLYLVATLVYGEANSNDTAETIRWSFGNSSTFDTDSKIFEWTPTSGDDRTFSVGDTAADVTVATVFDKDNVAYAIPQTINEFDYRETYVYFTTESGGSTVQKAKIPQTKLEPGKIYTFTLVIGGSSVKVNVDIEDWTETQANVDIVF